MGVEPLYIGAAINLTQQKQMNKSVTFLIAAAICSGSTSIIYFIDTAQTEYGGIVRVPALTVAATSPSNIFADVSPGLP